MQPGTLPPPLPTKSVISPYKASYDEDEKTFRGVYCFYEIMNILWGGTCSELWVGVEHASGYGLSGTSSNLWVDVEHAANKKSVRFEEKSPPEVLPYILYFTIQSKCRDNLRATIVACLTS